MFWLVLEFLNLFEYESFWGMCWGENDFEYWDCGFFDWGVKFFVFFIMFVIVKIVVLEVDEFDEEEDEDVIDKGELCLEKFFLLLGFEYFVLLCVGLGFVFDEGEILRVFFFEVEICFFLFIWEGFDFKEE